MNYTKSELACLYVDSFPFLDYEKKRDLLDGYFATDSLEKAQKSFLEKHEKDLEAKDVATMKSSLSREYLDGLLNILADNGATFLTETSDGYPDSLRELENPPIALYAIGDVSLLLSKMFTVIGSRKCLPLAERIAENYGATLARAGFTHVSGIAEGADSAGIRGALSENGKVISVICGGMDRLYPKQNQGLADTIVEKGGLLISEQFFGVEPERHLFPIRNRIMAALGQGVLVVAAGLRSGTMYTVDYALGLGKDVFVVPYNLGVVSGEGCNEMIKAGAFLTTDPADILTAFHVTDPKEEKKEELPEDEEKVLFVIAECGDVHLDKLCESTGMKPYELLPILSMLEIKGKISKSAGNIFSAL